MCNHNSDIRNELSINDLVGFDILYAIIINLNFPTLTPSSAKMHRVKTLRLIYL